MTDRVEQLSRVIAESHGNDGWWYRQVGVTVVARDVTQPEIALWLLKELIDKFGMQQTFTEVQIELQEFAEELKPYSTRLELAIAESYARMHGLLPQ